MLFLINAGFGIAVGIGLYLIGVPNAVLCGILAAIFRFVPFIGTWVATVAPIGLAMAISTDWLAPILTLGLFAVMELFCGNVYDTLLIPALALAETDWHRGELDEGRHNFILQSLREMIQESGEDHRKAEAKEPIADAGPPQPCILCLPARDEADEIAGMMLGQLLAAGDCLVQSAPFTAVAGDVVDLLERRTPDAICISATPPAAVMHARHLCRLVRNRFPLVPVVVGLWNAEGDLSKAKTRIGSGAATHVVTTLAEAQEQVRLLIKPLVPPENDAQLESSARVAEAARP
jgi:hypothetical protein